MSYRRARSAQRAGEEFLLILPDTDTATAQRIAESVCASIAMLEMPHVESSLRVVTVSAGIAVLAKNTYKEADELLRAADIALYQAKQNGRNQAQIAPEHISNEALQTTLYGALG